MDEFHRTQNKAEYNIPEAIVLCNDNVRIDGKVVYMPIYMAMFLQRKRVSNAGEYIPDISALLALQRLSTDRSAIHINHSHSPFKENRRYTARLYHLNAR